MQTAALGKVYLDNLIYDSRTGNIKFEQGARRWLDENPTALKVSIYVGILIRTLPMYALISFLPYSYEANCAIALAGSLFYAVALERCRFRFSMLSCVGAFAVHFSLPALNSIVNGVALNSLTAFSSTLIEAAPFALFCGISILFTNSLMKKPAEQPQICCSN